MWLSPSHEIKTVSTRWKRVWKSTIAMDGIDSFISVPRTGPLPRSALPLSLVILIMAFINFIWIPLAKMFGPL